jgi:hypothetical protein
MPTIGYQTALSTSQLSTSCRRQVVTLSLLSIIRRRVATAGSRLDLRYTVGDLDVSQPASDGTLHQPACRQTGELTHVILDLAFR